MERSTVERRYNLTPLVWSSEDLYMSTFWVEVTATVGALRSQPATSNTFTFSIVETANLTCESPGVGSEVTRGGLRPTVWLLPAGELEFPPLALLRKDRLDASLTFRNPFHFYRELQQAQRTGSSSLSVTVTSQDVRGQEVTPLQAGERLTAIVLPLLSRRNPFFPAGRRKTPADTRWCSQKQPRTSASRWTASCSLGARSDR